LSELQGVSKCILLTLDNFHLIDSTSFETFADILKRLQSTPILFAISYQPSHEITTYLEELRLLGKPHASINLSPLLSDEMVTLGSDTSSLPLMICQSCLERAGGNPGYYQQLLDCYDDDDVIPATIMLHLKSRFYQLSPLARQILAFIALSDTELTLRDLSLMMSVPDSSIQELVDSRLVWRSHDNTFVLSHRFIQDFVRDKVAYRSMCSIYMTLAEHLKCHSSLPEFETCVILADYYRRSEAYLKAAEVLLQCCQLMLEQGEYSKANQYLQQALENQQKAAPSAEANEQLLEIRLRIAMVTRMSHGWVSHSTVSAYQHCITLAKQQQSIRRHCVALSGVWVTELMSMEFQQSEKTANEMLSLAKQGNELNCISLAYSCLANSQFWLAKHDQAIDSAKMSLHYFQGEDEDIQATVGFNPQILACCFGALSASILCDESMVKDFLSYHQHQELGPFGQAVLLQGEAWVNFHRRQTDAVFVLSEKLLRLSETYNFPFYKGVAMIFEGWALFFKQPTDEMDTRAKDALKIVEEGYTRWLSSSGDLIAYSLYILIKAELCFHMKLFDEATYILEEGIALTIEKNEVCYLAPMYAMLAKLKRNDDWALLAERIAMEQNATLFLQDEWLFK
jgi:tetratricopeptide (TPR) repeat protein